MSAHTLLVLLELMRRAHFYEIDWGKKYQLSHIDDKNNLSIVPDAQNKKNYLDLYALFPSALYMLLYNIDFVIFSFTAYIYSVISPFRIASTNALYCTSDNKWCDQRFNGYSRVS